MTDFVSRETPPAPEAAAGVFSRSLPHAERFAEILAREGVVRGLIGPREVPRLWERHLINCALLGNAIEHGADVCDIGSGAGLPGLVLALRRPDLRLTLVEPLLRRSSFLEEAVDELALGNVEVVRARAEELHGRREFAVVTARAVAPLERLLAWSMPLVRKGGVLLAMKGSSARAEIDAASEALARYGAGSVDLEEYWAPGVDRPAIVVRVEAAERSRLGWDAARARPRRNRPKPGSSRKRDQ